MPVSAVSSINDSHVNALRQRHAALSQEIEIAQRSLSSSDFFLIQLKKQRLLVKEKLVRFESRE